MSPQHWVGSAPLPPGDKEAMALVEAEEVLRYTARFVGKDEQAAVASARQYARTMRPIEAYARARHELVVRAGFAHGDSGELLELARRQVALTVAFRVLGWQIADPFITLIVTVQAQLERVVARFTTLAWPDRLAVALGVVFGVGEIAVGTYATVAVPDSGAVALVTFPVGVALLIVAASAWRNS